MATENSVAGWTTVTTSKVLNLSNGSTTFAPFTLDVLENTVPQGQLLISNPQNNSQFTEGDWVSLEVLASGIDLSQFKHVEVTLQDFNKVNLLSFTTNSVNANTAFKVPAVDRYDTYTIRVRAYFEQSYNYIEKSVGIKVVPLRQSLDANIQGVGNKVYSNSLVTLSTDIPQHADFKVSTLNGTIIASGVEPVSFAVPNDIDSFTIEALLKDGLGNETKVDKQVAVAQPYQLIKDSPVSPFEYQFSIANNQYTINHSKLYKDGLPVSQFDGNVLDAKLLQDRLLIALEGLGIAFMSWQDDYAILGIYPSQIDFKALAIYEQQVFAISDAGNIIVFDIKGNSLEPSAQQLPSGTLAQQVVVANDGIWVTYQDTLTRFNHELEVDLSFELSAEVAHSVVHNGHLIAFDELGGLYRIDNGRLSQHQLTVMAINAVSSLGNELLAYDGLANELLIISLNEATPYVIYRENIQSDISDLFVSNGVITSNNGDVWTLNQNQNAPYRQLFTSNKHKGSSEHIVLHNGSAIVAEKTYALTQYTGLPNHARRSFFPSEYASEFSALIFDNTDIYAFDKVSGYLYQVNSAQLSGSQHLGKFASNSMFSTDENYLYAATSDQLTIISKDDFEQRYTFTVAAGEVITALKATPTEVYVATLDGTIYRVSHPGLPMEEFALRVDSVIATNSVIEEINTLGDTLVLTSRTELSSYNLSENIYQTILSNKVQDVVIKGQSVLYALDNEIFEHKLSSNTPDKLMYQAKADIAGFAISKDQLAVALGVNGVELAWRGEQPSQLVADLTKPANKTHFVHGQAIDLAVAHSADLVSVDYYVNDALVARSEHFPFSVQIPIPGELRNGNEFTVHAVTKDRIGNSVVGNKRTMLLHSQDLPQNNFNVELLYRNPSYVPAPLKIEALVKNATQDIRQVEFYLSDDESGPYKLIRKHYGPEFIVRNNFTLAQSGQFIKARAIDVYGNVTESQPTVIQRHLDDEVPQVSLSLESPLNDAKRVTTTYPYGIAFNVSDTGSAINLALLKRDNTVIWAGFTDTQSRIEQHAKNTGDTYVYSLEVSDNANNTNSTSLNVEVVEDERPVVNDISLPNAVLEQSAFEVTMNVQDDIEVAYIEVQWPNFVKRYPVNERQINKTLSIQDTRSLRVNSDKNETLTLLIVDSKGQQTRVEKSITVMKDQAPHPKLSNLSFADAAIYGSKLNGTLIDLNLVDDGLLRELALDLLIYQGGELKVAKPICDINRNIVCRETMNASIQVPSTTVANDQIHIALRATDKLGQVTVSDQHAILLSQVPNAIVLTDEFDSANLSLAKVGVPAEFAFRVKDLANRSVALQDVDLVISQRDSAQKISNSVITDSNGVAYFSVDTSDLVVSEYVAEATLRDYPNILPAIVRFEVLPGEPSAIRVEHIAPIRANETANLMLELVDAAGNKATNVPNANVALVFNHPGFHFAFDPNVLVEPYYQGENYVGEKALITLVGGKANIEFQATEVMGEYKLARLSDNLADVGLSYQSEQDGSYQISADIPLNVTANVPARLVMSLSAMSNDISGREDVLEQTETATLQLQLTDEFGNQITEIDGQPANGEVNVFVSGDAMFTNDTNQFVVALNNGAATFTVTNNTVEEVIISVTNIANSLNIDAESDLTLNFARLLARVVDTKLVQVVDLDITPLEVKFNEPVSLTSGFAWPTVSLQGVNVEGEFSFDDDVTLRFIPNQPLTLGAVYELSTHGTAIVSNETQETIFASHYEFIGPDLSLPEQTLGYLLSEQTSTLTLALADNYTWDQINELNFISDNLSLAVSAQTHELTAPVIAEQDEGKQIVASVSARIEETSLFVANARTFILLTQAGDFDGDGISNDLEHQLGYHPLKQDSDGNGVSDANEDYDNDGLSNALEIQLGGKIDNADSDDDGVNDGTEYQWGSDINNADTDGDGIDDAIEIASGSDPTDANDRAIKPELVTNIQITSKSVTHNIGADDSDIRLTIKATISINNRNFIIDVSDSGFFDLVFESLDESVVIPSYQGFSAVDVGETQVKVHFGEHTDTATIKVVEVINLGDVVLENETAKFSGPVFADSITMRGWVNLIVNGELLVNNDLVVEANADVYASLKELSVSGDMLLNGAFEMVVPRYDIEITLSEITNFKSSGVDAYYYSDGNGIKSLQMDLFLTRDPDTEVPYYYQLNLMHSVDNETWASRECHKITGDFDTEKMLCDLSNEGFYKLSIDNEISKVDGVLQLTDLTLEPLLSFNKDKIKNVSSEFDLYADLRKSEENLTLNITSDRQTGPWSSTILEDSPEGFAITAYVLREGNWQKAGIARCNKDDTTYVYCTLPKNEAYKITITPNIELEEINFNIQHFGKFQILPKLISSINVSGNVNIQRTSLYAMADLNVGQNLTIDSSELGLGNRIDVGQSFFATGHSALIIDTLNVVENMTYSGSLFTSANSITVSQKLNANGRIEFVPNGEKDDGCAISPEAFDCLVKGYLNAHNHIKLSANRITVDTDGVWLESATDSGWDNGDNYPANLSKFISLLIDTNELVVESVGNLFKGGVIEDLTRSVSPYSHGDGLEKSNDEERPLFSKSLLNLNYYNLVVNSTQLPPIPQSTISGAEISNINDDVISLANTISMTELRIWQDYEWYKVYAGGVAVLNDKSLGERYVVSKAPEDTGYGEYGASLNKQINVQKHGENRFQKFESSKNIVREIEGLTRVLVKNNDLGDVSSLQAQLEMKYQELDSVGKTISKTKEQNENGLNTSEQTLDETPEHLVAVIPKNTDKYNDAVLFGSVIPYLNVGLHDIESVSKSDSDVYVVSVTGNPWLSNTSEYGRELTGLHARLFNAQAESIDVEIMSNSESALTVRSTDDLVGFYPETLQGLHKFKHLELVGTYADFGDDIVEPESLYMRDSGIKAGQIPEEILDMLLSLDALRDVELNLSQDIHIKADTPVYNINGLSLFANNIVVDDVQLLGSGHNFIAREKVTFNASLDSYELKVVAHDIEVGSNSLAGAGFSFEAENNLVFNTVIDNSNELYNLRLIANNKLVIEQLVSSNRSEFYAGYMEFNAPLGLSVNQIYSSETSIDLNQGYQFFGNDITFIAPHGINVNKAASFKNHNSFTFHNDINFKQGLTLEDEAIAWFAGKGDVLINGDLTVPGYADFRIEGGQSLEITGSFISENAFFYNNRGPKIPQIKIHGNFISNGHTQGVEIGELIIGGDFISNNFLKYESIDNLTIGGDLVFGENSFADVKVNNYCNFAGSLITLKDAMVLLHCNKETTFESEVRAKGDLRFSSDEGIVFEENVVIEDGNYSSLSSGKGLVFNGDITVGIDSQLSLENTDNQQALFPIDVKGNIFIEEDQTGRGMIRIKADSTEKDSYSINYKTVDLLDGSSCFGSECPERSAKYFSLNVSDLLNESLFVADIPGFIHAQNVTGTGLYSLSESSVNLSLAFNVVSQVDDTRSSGGKVFVNHINSVFGDFNISTQGINSSNIDFIKLPIIGKHTISRIEKTDINTWKITANTANWQDAKEANGFSITGEYVDLDNDDNDERFYQIVSHTANTITITTNEDLSAFLGRTLVGVHAFDTFKMGDFTRLDIDVDKLEISDLENSSIGQNVVINMGQQSERMTAWLEAQQVIKYEPYKVIEDSLVLASYQSDLIDAKTLTIKGDLILNANSTLELYISEQLVITGNLVIETGAKITGNTETLNIKVMGNVEINRNEPMHFNKFDVQGTVELNGNVNIMLNEAWFIGSLTVTPHSLFTISTPYIDVSQNLTVMEYGKISLPENIEPYLLDIRVKELINVETGAEISVSNTVEKFSNLASNRYSGCHGGANYSAQENCTYGNYADPDTVGSTGTIGRNLQAGGILKLQSKRIDLKGMLTSDGKASSYYKYLGGSGGSIKIIADVISGAGMISASSKYTSWNRNYYRYGGGGRVAIYAMDNQFSGDIKTTEDINYSYAPGEGTVYIATNVNEPGILEVSKQNSASSLSNGAGTFIRGAGKHQIECVNKLEGNLWKIDTDCSQENSTKIWVDSISDKQRSLVGRKVDLNVDDTNDEIYEIVANDQNSLTVRASKDLTNLAGATLQGIHLLKGLKVINSANVDFGNNRVEVSDINEAVFTPDVTISLGSANQELVEKLNSSGANIIWH
ncbi:exo-alpha-sialidase [Pseudoalteromonas sp. T1lg24]|uniref:exo-alpha-sialidase n=1 Tax=Pseudoalteromonas sp. T1lg24 TaxID=2077099 RepID=UPI000CF7235F|nr:exo-alpha-sialidase [Pseudoalteromonas sp. T1lg24]